MKLSVIIPARDEEENIEQTIKNLVPFIQPADMEIIVVNDHSQDRTPDVINQLQKKYSFIWEELIRIWDAMIWRIII